MARREQRAANTFVIPSKHLTPKHQTPPVAMSSAIKLNLPESPNAHDVGRSILGYIDSLLRVNPVHEVAATKGHILIEIPSIPS